MRTLLLGLGLFVVAACTTETDASGSSPNDATHAIDAAAFCNKYVTECQVEAGSVTECITTFTAARFTKECSDAFAATTDCDGFKSNVLDLCLPECEAAGQRCNSDHTATVCTAGLRQVTLACDAICSGSGAKYTGTCGTSYMGETSDTVKCWCTR